MVLPISDPLQERFQRLLEELDDSQEAASHRIAAVVAIVTVDVAVAAVVALLWFQVVVLGVVAIEVDVIVAVAAAAAIVVGAVVEMSPPDEVLRICQKESGAP